VLVLLAAVLLFVLWPGKRVTKANFEHIAIGMPQSDLHALLGTPEYEARESGLVVGPESYIVNATQSEEEQRRRGFLDYQRQQWSSQELSIVVILDADQRVACRYTGPAQQSFFERIRIYLSKLF
jgi:hypothetical protein